MQTYEVRVEGVVVEIYEVEANSVEEARENWNDGFLVSQEGHSYGVESVELMVDDFDEDEDDYPEDEYEVDPLHVVEYG